MSLLFYILIYCIKVMWD